MKFCEICGKKATKDRIDIVLHGRLVLHWACLDKAILDHVLQKAISKIKKGKNK